MIRTSKQAFPWTLPWGGTTDTVVMLRAGDVIERGDFEGDLAGQRAGRVFDFELTQAFDGGLAALLHDAPADLERMREIIATAEGGDELPADEKALLDAARETVAEHWPPFRALIAQAARRNELTPTLAFQRFVTGWEGVDLDGNPLPPFRTGMDGRVSIDLMGDIPPLMIRLAGMRAYQLLWATGDEKNLERPSPSDENRSPSTSDTPKKGGSSGKTTGRKTPSRRSPRKSSRSSTSGLPAND